MKDMFVKYNSIENSYREEFLSRIKSHGFWGMDYVVQEKVHGSNISFWTSNGINFEAGKRTAPLESSDKFYNFQKILEKHKDPFSKIYKQLKLAYPEMEQMTLFGELIGGNYPHKEVAKDNSALKVQKGIHYCPHNEFYAFDIKINGATYLDVDTVNPLFESAGLLYAKTLFQGSLNECLKYPNAFDSTIPEDLGLPALSPNICEGVVIRPMKNCFFNGGNRVILKNKNEKWSEKIKLEKKIRISAPLSEQVILLQEAILAYVTENRFQNLLSKTGEFTKSEFGKTLGLLSKDVVDDFKKDYSESFGKLDRKEQKQITKFIAKPCAALIHQYLYEDV
jgi:Rnl2 family RNA ligase